MSTAIYITIVLKWCLLSEYDSDEMWMSIVESSLSYLDCSIVPWRQKLDLGIPALRDVYLLRTITQQVYAADFWLIQVATLVPT